MHARLGKSRFYKMLLAYTSYISSLVLARNSLVIARAVSRWSPIRGPGFHGPIIDFWIEGSRRAWHAAPLLGAAAAAAAVLFAVYAYEWIVRERGRFPCGRASAPVLGVLLLALVASASLGHVVLTLPGGKAPLPVVRWEASRTLVRVSIEDELGGRLGWAQALARVNGSLVQIPLVMRGGNITIYLSALGGSRVEAGYVELLAHIYYPWGGVGVLRARIPIGVPAGATVGMDRIVLHASNTGGTILVWGSPVEGCRLVDHVEVYSEWLRLDASTTGFNETCHAALPGAPSYYIKVYYWDAGRLHVYTRGPLGPGNTTIVVKLPGGRG